MAKNISLFGANYPDVPAVQLPQTGGGTAAFYDIQVVDNLNSDSATDALSAKQGKVLNGKLTKETLTVTKGTGINTIDIVARRSANIVCVSGYILIPAGTYDDTDPLINISANPDSNIFFFDQKGRLMRIIGAGDVIYHSSTTFDSDEIVFFNFCYAV